MSVSPSFRSFVLEQLARTTPGIRARSMFGGVGIYAAELFFALLDDDTLYFKVDDATRPRGLGRGGHCGSASCQRPPQLIEAW